VALVRAVYSPRIVTEIRAPVAITLFADPGNKISFAYVMNQMEQSILPNEKSLRLLSAIYE
jgi:hypothetical protein